MRTSFQIKMAKRNDDVRAYDVTQRAGLKCGIK